jgi:SWI/SNF-related matrix-associated actin-dependent regulator of chromatin subfamily E protein 1
LSFLFQILKRQVQSLTKFQQTLEKELCDIDTRHEERKRKYDNTISAFEDEMKKHTKKAVVVDKDMVDQQLEKLKQVKAPATQQAAPATPTSPSPQHPPAPTGSPQPVVAAAVSEAEMKNVSTSNGTASSTQMVAAATTTVTNGAASPAKQQRLEAPGIPNTSLAAVAQN